MTDKAKQGCYDILKGNEIKGKEAYEKSDGLAIDAYITATKQSIEKLEELKDKLSAADVNAWINEFSMNFLKNQLHVEGSEGSLKVWVKQLNQGILETHGDILNTGDKPDIRKLHQTFAKYSNVLGQVFGHSEHDVALLKGTESYSEDEKRTAANRLYKEKATAIGIKAEKIEETLSKVRDLDSAVSNIFALLIKKESIERSL